MRQSEPTIGVIIVAHNTAAMLLDCLRSLQRCTLSLRIVVVDNASTDESVAWVRTHFPQIDLFALDRNLGFAGGNNVGLRALGCVDQQPVVSPAPVPALLEADLVAETERQQSARYRRQSLSFAFERDVRLLDNGLSGQGDSAKPELADPPWAVLLLNPDTIVQPGAIEALAAFLQQHPRVGMVSPRLLNPDGSIQPAAFRFPTLMMSALEVFPPGEVLPGRLYHSWWHGRYPQERAGQTPFPIDHALGACMLVRREAIAEAGLLDERYFMYSEEIDWCWRIRRCGWAIWQVPAAQVTHIGGAATRQFRQRMLVELYRSRVAFFRQHYSHKFLQAHRLITRLGMIRAALLSWRDYQRGCIGQDELRARLLAYGAISQL
jgi:GT2 family glycosyltransferase